MAYGPPASLIAYGEDKSRCQEASELPLHIRVVSIAMKVKTLYHKPGIAHPWQWYREDVVKYLLVFNPKAKRYNRASAAALVRQAARLLGGTVAVTYTTPQPTKPGMRYDIADFARHSHNSDCVIAVGGDG